MLEVVAENECVARDGGFGREGEGDGVAVVGVGGVREVGARGGGGGGFALGVLVGVGRLEWDVVIEKGG